MGKIRIIIGIAIILAGFAVYVTNVYSNPLDLSKSIDIEKFQSGFTIIIGAAIAIGIGAGIAGWGIRSYS